MEKLTLQVCNEDGWTYNGKYRKLGDEFQIAEDQLRNMQKFVDNGDIQVKVETSAIDAVKQGELIAVGVEAGMEKLTPIIKDLQKSVANIKVHDRYNDDPEFQDNGGYEKFTDFVKDVYRIGSQQKPSETYAKYEASDVVKAATSMGEAIQSDGGVLTPTVFRNQILTNAVEDSIVFSRATFIPMATGKVAIPTVEVSSHATTLFGGVQAYWVDEGTPATASKPKLGKVELDLHALRAITHVSEELLEDSIVSLETLLPTQFSAALSYQMDEAFLEGTGAGKPLGVTKAPALVTVAKETGQLADTIDINNILNMYQRMYSPSRSKAVWVANQGTFAQLATMSLPVGTGGAPAGILQMQNIQGQPVMTMLGSPILFTEKLPVLGDANDIIFCDFSQYLIGGKSASGASMQSSIHLKFDSHETTFRISQRMDGQPWWKTALTPRKGSETLSPFVALGERS